MVGLQIDFGLIIPVAQGAPVQQFERNDGGRHQKKTYDSRDPNAADAIQRAGPASITEIMNGVVQFAVDRFSGRAVNLPGHLHAPGRLDFRDFKHDSSMIV